MAYTYAGMYGAEAVFNGSVRAAPSDTVLIRLVGTTTAADLYTDRTKAAPAANPVVVNALGNISFFADPGQYDQCIIIDGVPGTPETITVPIDPDEAAQDADVTALTATVTALDARVDTVEVTTIPALDTRLDTLEGTSVPEAEARLDALETTVIPASYYLTLQGAIDVAEANGGGVVDGGFNEYITSAVVLPSLVKLRNVTLKLADGANTFLLESDGFAGLTGGATNGGIVRFGLENVTFDGNAANNASAIVPLVRLYGYDYHLDHVDIHHSNDIGLWCEWGSPSDSPGNFNMESVLHDVKVMYGNSHGIVWRGPHDSMWDSVISGHNAGRGFWIAGDGGALIARACHAYGLEGTEPWYCESTTYCTDCTGEGASNGALAQVVFAASDCSWHGGQVFSDPTWVGATDIGFQIGVGTPVLNCQIDTRVLNCADALVNFGNDGGGNRLVLNAYQPTGAMYLGTRHAATDVTIHGSGAALVREMLYDGRAIFGGSVNSFGSNGPHFIATATAVGNNRAGYSFVADGTEQYQILTDHALANAQNLAIYDAINDALRMIVNELGVVGFPTGIGVGNSVAATTPGSVVKKIQVFDAAGASLGYLAVYSAIT